MGAPAFAVPTLERLMELKADVVAVYTKRPSEAGRRGLEVTRTSVHRRAAELDLPVYTPPTLRSVEAVQAFRNHAADVAIVAAYGLILPGDILKSPNYCCLNLHASLLPRWRGAAPIQRAIMSGDKKTGICLMRMEEGLDTGPVAGELSIPIKATETAGELGARLAHLAADLLASCWKDIVGRSLSFVPQSSDGVSYAKKIEKAESIIDWNRDAVTLCNHINGLAPQPGAYSAFLVDERPERFKILRAEVTQGSGSPGELLSTDFHVACGVGALRAIEVQRAGKSVSQAESMLRGARLRIGERFISSDAILKSSPKK